MKIITMTITMMKIITNTDDHHREVIRNTFAFHHKIEYRCCTQVNSERSKIISPQISIFLIHFGSQYFDQTPNINC